MPVIQTVREQIAWSYANLARAHAALIDESSQYTQKHHMIRNRLFHGLLSGRMSIRSLYDDERLKMVLPQACAYCGSRENLSLDHLIPRSRGAKDESDNLVWACRSCNSSKRNRDFLQWMSSQDVFPSIYVLRRYLKIVALRCESLGIFDHPLGEIKSKELPFDLELLPHSFPPLADLVLWVRAKGAKPDATQSL
jgi:5-methylcytosine-specific restriction endonuclease McrA